MRKVLFTEAQIKRILGEDYPLSTKGGEVPGNAYGTEVGTNMTNVDQDATPSVTTTDKIAKNKIKGNRWFGVRTRATVVEEGDADDERTAGYGTNYDKTISNVASNGGKMANNMDSEKSHRLNTNQVRASRMEKYKKEDPATYAKNGGDEMLKILKSTVKRQQNTANSQKASSVAIDSIIKGDETPDVRKGTGKGHRNQNETSNGASIYYY